MFSFRYRLTRSATWFRSSWSTDPRTRRPAWNPRRMDVKAGIRISFAKAFRPILSIRPVADDPDSTSPSFTRRPRSLRVAMWNAGFLQFRPSVGLPTTARGQHGLAILYHRARRYLRAR